MVVEKEWFAAFKNNHNTFLLFIIVKNIASVI